LLHTSSLSTTAASIANTIKALPVDIIRQLSTFQSSPNKKKPTASLGSVTVTPIDDVKKPTVKGATANEPKSKLLILGPQIKDLVKGLESDPKATTSPSLPKPQPVPSHPILSKPAVGSSRSKGVLFCCLITHVYA